MNKEAAADHILQAVSNAVNGGISFLAMAQLFPPETREQSVAALKELGYKQASGILESITGHHSLSRLWD